MKVIRIVFLCLAVTGCDQRSNGAVECPSDTPNKVGEGVEGFYKYREDCAPNALTCIDPAKLNRTGNGVVVCRHRGA